MLWLLLIAIVLPVLSLVAAGVLVVVGDRLWAAAWGTRDED